MFNIVLYQPEIPPNTGSIIRLAANTGCNVHLIEPLGFTIEDKKMKRAGLDYFDKSRLFIHQDLNELLKNVNKKNIFLCSTKGENYYTNVNYNENDYLIFGPETRGLPQDIINNHPKENVIKIPMQKTGRSLNLSIATSIIVYEAWRQIDFKMI